MTACLRTVLQSAEEGGPTTATELAEAVAQFLTGARPPGTLRTYEIGSLLPRVLDQTGHPSAAATLREHTRLREKLRRYVRVLVWQPGHQGSATRRWNKTVLVSHLRRRRQLEHETARMIAGRVESVVLGLNLRVITAGLVREVTESELMAWGLSEQSLLAGRTG